MAHRRTNTEGAVNETIDEGFAPRLNEMSKTFISEGIEEKERLGEDFPMAAMLIDEAIDRVQSTGRIPGREMYADVFKQKPIKIAQKVYVPTKQFPKFNFNGKILGPKGNSLRRLQEETMCRIGIKGRNSMRDSEKEEELRQSGDPRHAHLHKDLFVEVTTIAPPAEAYARVAYALAEIRKYLIPDKNDEVSQNQLKEIMADPETAQKGAQFVAILNGRSNSKGNYNSKGGVSILKKITGQSFDSHERDSDDNDNDNDDYNEGSSRYAPSYQQMRQSSQRTALKRPYQSQQQNQQNYQSPQKRSRESSGPPKSSPFAFFKKYQ